MLMNLFFLVLSPSAFASPAEYRFVGAGLLNSCLAKKDSIFCVGDDRYSAAREVDGFSNIRQVSVAYDNVCVLDDRGVTCYGNNEEGESTVPYLENPKFLANSGNTHCAIDDEGVKCWGTNSALFQNDSTPTLKNLKKLSLGAQACAIDDEGLKCWGNPNMQAPKNLKNPREIAAGGFTSCAIDDDGVKCWGQVEQDEDTYPCQHLKTPPH